MRTAHEIIVALTGEAAPQQPCEDPADQTCIASSCPDLLFESLKGFSDIIGAVDPGSASKIDQGAPSVTAPSTLNDLVRDSSIGNIALGERLSSSHASAYHYAGTAAFGRVVDKSFKVLGTSGLYIADGSVLPKTTRVNIMASILMLGRLAGTNAVNELPWTS